GHAVVAAGPVNWQRCAARAVVVVLLAIRVRRALIRFDVHGPYDSPVLIGIRRARSDRNRHARIGSRSRLIKKGLLLNVGQKKNSPIGPKRDREIEKVVLVLARGPPRNGGGRRESLKRAFIVG